MHPDTRQVSEHMRQFGLAILGRAVYDVTFSEMSRPFAHAMAVGHAAHGAEIVIKARIAQEHPLLIFNNLPKSTTTTGHLTISELFQHGRTIQFHELPEVLWATTGVRLEKADKFKAFGNLRNTIIHFAAPNADLACETLRFCFDVIEPLVQKFWSESLFYYAEEWDEVTVADGCLTEQLERCDVEITQEMSVVIKEIRGR